MARQAQAAACWYSPGDSAAKCRQRRRRRMEMRRERPNWPATTAPYINRKAGKDEEEEELISPPPPWLRLCRNPMPAFSSISIDADGAAVRVEEDFCRPAADVFAGGEPLHFFAVYDGHATALYKQLMQRVIAEELARVDATADGISSGDGVEVSAARQSREWWNDRLFSALQRSFERMDRVAREALAFVGPCAAVAATVAVLTAEHIVVARGGGSSRAVLCSDGTPIPLSSDRRYNKPHHDQGLPDLERVCEVDGMMVPNYHDHIGLREYEILDVSRPPGNNLLKSSSSRTSDEPEIFIIERSKEEDECLILASDGVWDVISDDIACNVATTCLRDGHIDTSYSDTFGHSSMLLDHDDQMIIQGHNDNDQMFSSYLNGVDAAALLCRLALGRGSSGGISVIVVDFKEH